MGGATVCEGDEGVWREQAVVVVKEALDCRGSTLENQAVGVVAFVHDEGFARRAVAKSASSIDNHR